jgi:hypothetical protein
MPEVNNINKHRVAPIANGLFVAKKTYTNTIDPKNSTKYLYIYIYLVDR